MPEQQRIGLVAFDLDGTLIRGDTVCLCFARRLNHLGRMLEIEQLRELDALMTAREELARYYRAIPQSELRSCLAEASLAPGAEEGFALLRQHGMKTAIVSITWEFAVAWFAQKLGADSYVGTQLADNGSIAHFFPSDKAGWLIDLADELGLASGEIAAVGDSWGDIAMLRAVGYPFFVGPTMPEGLHAIHVPSGDILAIARQIIGATNLPE